MSGFWISSNPSSPGKNVPLEDCYFTARSIDVSHQGELYIAQRDRVPEHMASIFTIRNPMKPQIYLGLDNIFNCSVFYRRELFIKAGMITLELVNLMSNVQKLYRA